MILTLNKLNASALKFNLETANVVENICKPLFDSFGITNFGYAKIFPDGTMLRVSADQEWTKKYFENQFYNDTCFYDFEELAENSSEIRIITNNPLEKHYQALYEHDIWHIFTIFKRQKDYAEVWFFATSREKQDIINFYVNHKDIMVNFIEHFTVAASPILIINNPEILISTELKLHHCEVKENQKINQFLKEICCHDEKHHLSLTSREIDCVRQLILGKTAKETACIMHISHRTVEAHITNIKRKAGCNKISQLIKVLFEQKY